MDFDSGVMKALERHIRKASELIKKSCRERRRIALRYHGDADGIAGAIAVRDAVKQLGATVRASQNSLAVYDVRSAATDARQAGLAILVDFASNEESIAALKHLRASGVCVVLIDHHPPARGVELLVDAFVSPWAAGGDSNYSAGFLAAEVAKAISGRDYSLLARIALTGDRSRLISSGEKLLAQANALDYLASGKASLEHCAAVLADEKKMLDACARAQAMLEGAVAKARRASRIRRLANGFALCLVKLEHIAKEGRFPSRGRISGMLHDELLKQYAHSPLITVGYNAKQITIRANPNAAKAGFNATEIIAKIKEELPGTLVSGGGHAVAASMRTRAGYAKIALDALVRSIASL
jgi:RecJ-like exonuclease